MQHGRTSRVTLHLQANLTPDPAGRTFAKERLNHSLLKSRLRSDCVAKMIDFEQGVWFYSSALAAAVPVMIPALQFGFIYKIWDKYNKKVDRHNCRNTCWDTVFKGDWTSRICTRDEVRNSRVQKWIENS